MKKFILLLALGIGTFSFAFSQNFSHSNLSPGQQSQNTSKAPAATYFITHSVSQTVMTGSGVSCAWAGVHTENSYLRVFDLENDFGITGDINVTSVDIGVENAFATSGTQPGTVNLYTLSGPLLYANMTLVASQNISIANQTLSIINVPISALIPAGSILVLEFYIPDAYAVGDVFYPGANNLGQTGPSYIASASCSIPEPTDLASLGFPNSHFVMNVNAEPTETVPVSTWAIVIGMVLMTGFIIFRFKR